MASGKDRQRAMRERRRAAGLRFYEICIHPSEWPLVKRYIERLAKKRERT